MHNGIFVSDVQRSSRLSNSKTMRMYILKKRIGESLQIRFGTFNGADLDEAPNPINISRTGKVYFRMEDLVLVTNAGSESMQLIKL